MVWKLEFAPGAETDFGLIFDHLFESYQAFGEPPEDAFEHARARVLHIRNNADRILVAPHRGQRHDDLLPGARNLEMDRASYWFTADETSRTVTVLAVFFGGQDQQRRMMVRLLGKE